MVDDIDTILNMRAAPTARSHLSQRIIDASKLSPLTARAEYAEPQGWMELFFGSILLPKPAFAMAALLIAGLLWGIMLAEDMEFYNAADNAFQTAYIEDNFDSGRWL